MKKSLSTVLAITFLGMVAGAAQAKVSAAEAAKLGTTLTCTGAEKAGNADGSIPAFSGKWLGAPDGVSYKNNVGQHIADPYASEQPKFVITAANMAQYAAFLTDGQEKMFKKYPNTFKIPVYPTHRDFRLDDSHCDATKKAAVSTELSANGLDATGGIYGSIPFPIPKNGMEVLYNAMTARRSHTATVDRDTAVVSPNGNKFWSQSKFTSWTPANNPANFGKPVDKSANEGMAAFVLAQMLKPAQSKGLKILVKEPISYTSKRLTWLYEPGTRRVRQLPEFGFDQPMAGVNGRMTIDSDRLYNGSPERYNWKIVGKKEIFVPMNTYKLNNKLKYSDLLRPGHANPDYMRYELRRVWVVEADLKSGYRHLYAKRVHYADEDNWHALIADYYDGRGKLWRNAIANYYYAYDMKAWEVGASFYHELSSGTYIAYNLFQEMPRAPILNKGDLKATQFSPEGLRSLGN